jgi:hypothetical protein
MARIWMVTGDRGAASTDVEVGGTRLRKNTRRVARTTGAEGSIVYRGSAAMFQISSV